MACQSEGFANAPPVACPCVGGCTGTLRALERNTGNTLTFLTCDVCLCAYVAEDYVWPSEPPVIST